MQNKVILIGRLGKEPEVRTLESGKEIASFSLATSERYKDKATGEKKESTDWHRVVVYGAAVEFVKRFSKGSLVYVEGKLKNRKWTDKEGIERYSNDITIAPYSGKVFALEKKDSSEYQPPEDSYEEEMERYS
jgi:single-strand DNA-binding protein